MVALPDNPQHPQSFMQDNLIELAEETIHVDDIDIFLSLQAAMFSASSKRLPLEIWEQIGKYLYPSELCRLSRVSRWLYVCAGSLRVWEKWFIKTHGNKQQLQSIGSTPKARLYMRYMCAISLLVCEECGFCAKLESLPVDTPWEMPFPWVTWTSRPRMVQMCGHCRRRLYSPQLHREPFPPEINRSFLLKKEILEVYREFGIREEDVKSIQVRRGGGRMNPCVRYHEGAVWAILRDRCGGDVGVNASAETVYRIQLQTLIRLRSLMLKQVPNQ